MGPRQQKPQARKPAGKTFFVIFILLLSLFFGIAIGAAAYIIRDTPDISQLNFGDWRSPEATFIYNRDEELVHRLFQENRQYVPLGQVPIELQQAVIATEDRRFFSHHGIDFWSVPRAALVDIREGRWAQGFSTITMQLARNVYLTQKKHLYRKLQEIFLAIQFERLYTKHEILEFYLNEIFFGHSAYGVQTAAQQYFGKDVSELNLAESTMLAGIIQAPNRLSPYHNMEGARGRQRVVLNTMVELGFITENEAREAAEEPIELVGLGRGEEQFGQYFLRYVRDQLLKMFGPQVVYSGGLRVYTTLDNRMQKAAEETIQKLIEDGTIPTVEREGYEGDPKQPQVSIVSIDPATGHILAMVGGRGEDQWNRVTQSHRQAGSSFKPIVYAAALENSYSPGNVLKDYPTVDFSEHTAVEEGDPYRAWPRNFNDQYLGPITLREALNRSQNVVAVKLLNEIGVRTGMDMAQRLGALNLVPDDRNLGLALGGLTRGITPLEMTQMFSVFANRGIKTEPMAILKVEDSRGNVLYQATPNKEIVISEEVNYLINDMLQTVITDGTGHRSDLGRPAAGKTGTTNDYTDAWFVGYTPDVATTVWVGEDYPRSMQYNPKRDSDGEIIINPETGKPDYQVTLSSWIASHIWGIYMREVVKPMPVTNFPSAPSDIIKVEIDPITGKLPGEYAPKVVEELFIKGTEPTEKETFHQPLESVDICIESGLLATPSCPRDEVKTHQYQRYSHIRVGTNGMPVPQFDPRTGAPITDEKGDLLYELKPSESCWIHDPYQRQEERDKDFLERIWEFLQPRQD